MTPNEGMKMEWLSVKEEEVDLDRIHLLVDGDSIYIKGSRMQPFFVQLNGEVKPLGSIEFTHWMPLPNSPII